MSGRRAPWNGSKNMNTFEEKQNQIPDEFKKLAKDFAEKGFYYNFNK